MSRLPKADQLFTAGNPESCTSKAIVIQHLEVKALYVVSLGVTLKHLSLLISACYNNKDQGAISGFRGGVNEVFALL